MRRSFATITALILSSACALAQPPALPDGAAPSLGGPPPAPKDGGAEKGDEEKGAAPSEGVVPLQGDTVFFKNGSKLEGVKVVRESPAGVEVQVTETDSLMIPRKQIDHIEYKQAEDAAVIAGAPDAEPSILKGQKVSPELYAKLTAPMPALDVAETDFVEALADLGKKLSVTIEIAAPVKRMAAKERSWSVKLDEGAKLSTVLEDLLAKFPTLQLDFAQEKIVVSVKDGAAAPAK
jgi:hypothetical protein